MGESLDCMRESLDKKKASLERKEKERENMDRRRRHKEKEKRFRSSMHPGVVGKEEMRRPMAKSNHSVSLGCDVETLEEYTAELERRVEENAKIIQNGID